MGINHNSLVHCYIDPLHGYNANLMTIANLFCDSLTFVLH